MRRACVLACLAAPSLALRLPPRLVAPRQKFKTSLLAEAEAAAPPAEAPKEEGASVAASTVNLVKSIVGAGVLALPAGVAAFSDAGPALWPATALITALGAASAYSFGVLGRVCGAYDAETYKDAWARSVGEKSAWVVCLAYSIIMGDAAASLIAAANPGPRVCSALNACGGARRGSIAALTVGALWPLCSLKSLAALAPTSALGTAGVVYTAGFMAKRALDGTYKAGATFVKSLSRDLAPKFGSTLVKPGLGLGVFVAMCGTAYMAHFNAPNFFVDARVEIKFRTPHAIDATSSP
jgi:amino acid permease